MTNTKSTKRALLASVMALLLCFTMLLGTTFAWFTDSVTSAGNIIQSGTLKVTMEWKDATANGAQQTYKNAAEGAIFNYDKWEPGYVEAKNIKIGNAGTLALKYQLAIVATGEVSELSDVIDVYYAEGEFTLADRDMTDLTKLGTLTEVLANMSTTANGDLLEGETDTVTIALKMQETAGNEYQGLSIGSEFAVQLLATQYTAESDSFDNQYDLAATWLGTIPASLDDTTLKIVPGDSAENRGTITVNSAEDLVYLSKLAAEWVSLYSNGQGTSVSSYRENVGGKGTAYYYHWQWNVELAADLNMNNIPMDSVDISYWDTFNGNGHTISNVVLKDGQDGLFNNGAKAINNLTVKNITVNAPEAQTVGAVAGNGTMTNVHVVNATVTGGKYVGGIAGKGSSFTNCSIKNSTVIGTDKTVGGLVGYSIGDPGAATVNGNTVENVTVAGAYNVGGLLGQSQNETVDGNTVKNVTVISTTVLPDDASTNEVRTAQLAARSDFDNTTIGENTVENVSTQEWGGAKPDTLVITPDEANRTGTITINSAEALVYLPKLAAEWASLYSASGNGTNYTDYKNGKGAAYYYSWGWTIELGADIDMYNIPVDPIDVYFWGTVDGNGHTISNVVVDCPETGYAALFSVTRGLVKDLNVNNVKVLGTEKNDNVGAVVGYCRGSMDNVHVTNATISGNNYVGTVAGKVESGIKNSSATNATVTAIGKTAGGLVGYTLGDTTGNTVDNVTVTGLYNVGGLLGQAQNKTVESNTVKNTTLISTSEIPADKAGDYVRTGEVVARNYNATVGDNTVENVTLQNK